MWEKLKDVGKKIDRAVNASYEDITEYGKDPEAFKQKLGADIDTLIGVLGSEASNPQRTKENITNLSQSIYKRFDVGGYNTADELIGQKYLDKKLAAWDDEKAK